MPHTRTKSLLEIRRKVDSRKSHHNTMGTSVIRQNELTITSFKETKLLSQSHPDRRKVSFFRVQKCVVQNLGFLCPAKAIGSCWLASNDGMFKGFDVGGLCWRICMSWTSLRVMDERSPRMGSTSSMERIVMNQYWDWLCQGGRIWVN